MTDMSGRTCMITGASSGIGRATALRLAALGARLVLICRDEGRGTSVLEEIRAAHGSASATLLIADLSSQAAIRQLAAQFLASGQPLHVLINNAGVVNLHHSLTTDGIETVFAVNHLAYFLLTHLLLERMRASAPARIVNVASDAHRFRGLRFDLPDSPESFRAMRNYGRSKLANILFTYELARRLEGSGVTANCLHPGAVATGLGQNNGRIAVLLTRLLRPFFRSADDGAATSVYLASALELAGVSGQYFSNCRQTRSSKSSYDLDLQREVWRLSAKMTGCGVE